MSHNYDIDPLHRSFTSQCFIVEVAPSFTIVNIFFPHTKREFLYVSVKIGFYQIF